MHIIIIKRDNAFVEMSSREGRLLPAIRVGIFKGFQEGQLDIANTLSLKRSASKITILTEGVMCLSWVSSLKCFVPYGRLKEKERDTHASEKINFGYHFN